MMATYFTSVLGKNGVSEGKGCEKYIKALEREAALLPCLELAFLSAILDLPRGPPMLQAPNRMYHTVWNILSLELR